MPDNQNIKIQSVTEKTVTFNVDGKMLEMDKKLDAVLAFVQSQSTKTIQSADKIYNIGSITNANFETIIGQANPDKSLPSDLAQALITDETLWVESLKKALLKQNASVGNTPVDVFKHYGWLIEIFLLKMGTPVGQERSLRRLSFMAEAYQSSLRFLSYIQVAQIMQMDEIPENDVVNGVIQLKDTQYINYDYWNLLLLSTEILETKGMFMTEIKDFVTELSDTKSTLYSTSLFLDKYRTELLKNTIPEDDQLNHLLDEYLTALVYWLRNLAFLGRYRLVSMKDINLDYRMGSPKTFVHIYGELHGMYKEANVKSEDYQSKSVVGAFTFNQSVLLFKGTDVKTSLDGIVNASNYLCLSPLIIDQSVFSEKPTQTPEILYYIGQTTDKKQYRFALYKNEMVLSGNNLTANKEIQVKEENIQQPGLNELFEQLELVFKPFKVANG